MRVLFVNPLAGLGGSERSLLDVVASLRAVRPDIDVRLLLFDDGELARAAGELGIDVVIEPLPEPLRRWGEAGRSEARTGTRELVRAGLAAPGFLSAVRRRVRDIAPDLVHTNGMKAHLVAAAVLRDQPLVVHLRDFVGQRPVSRTVFRALPRHSVVLANSHAVAADLTRTVPGLFVRAVHNAIDLEVFAPGPGEPARLAALSGLSLPPPGAISIGLVATYAWWKGHLDFISAASRVRAAVADPPLRFYVVGGPIYATHGSDVTRDELESAVRREGLEGVLGLVPFQPDAPSIYRNLDVVVHASTKPEPFGRTIVEAMACGKPVIVARAGGALELFEDGRSGLGFAPGNPGELANAMIRLARDPELRGALGAAGRRIALERFDRTRLGREVLEAYDDALRRRSSR